MAKQTMDLNNNKKPDDVKLLHMEASSNAFLILDNLGSGSFGIVQECLKIDTREIVALKILSKEDGQKELDILEALREIGQDKNNLVRFNGHHTLGDEILLEFEKLDKTLFDWIRMSGGKGRPLSEIQAIAKQMLVSLTALKSLNIVHADIKPNNVMLVDQQQQPSKVKLIDFGMATRVSELETGDLFQIIGFRAPEVMLGLPLSEAMDMWALGCILAYLYLGTCLYKLGSCRYQAMKNLVQINGQPSENMLNSGRHTSWFFTKKKYIQKPLWRLKEDCCCEECAVPGRKRTKSSQSSKGSPASYAIQKPGQFASLNDIVLTRPGAADNEDTQAFLSLLKKMLHLDAKERIDPSEALRHPFMTMKHFPSECVSNPDTPSAPGRRRVRPSAGSNAKGHETYVVGVKERYHSSAITSLAEASPERARSVCGEKISCTKKRAKGDAKISPQKKMKNFPSMCVSSADTPSAPRRRRVLPSEGSSVKGHKTYVVGVKERYHSSAITSQAEASPERARDVRGKKISCTKKLAKGDAEISPQKKKMKNFPIMCVSNADTPSAPRRRRVLPSEGSSAKGHKTYVVGVKERYHSSAITSQAEASPERATGVRGEKISCTKKLAKGDAEISPQKKKMNNFPSLCVSNADTPSPPRRRRVLPSEGSSAKGHKTYVVGVKERYHSSAITSQAEASPERATGVRGEKISCTKKLAKGDAEINPQKKKMKNFPIMCVSNADTPSPPRRRRVLPSEGSSAKGHKTYVVGVKERYHSSAITSQAEASPERATGVRGEKISCTKKLAKGDAEICPQKKKMNNFPSLCVSDADTPSAPRRRRVLPSAGSDAKGNKTCVVGVKERYHSSAITSQAEASPERATGVRGEKISCTKKLAKGDAEISPQKKKMNNFPSLCVSNADTPSAPRRRRVLPSAGSDAKGNKTCVVGVKERYHSSAITSQAEASPERATGVHGEKISYPKKRAKGDTKMNPGKKIMKNILKFFKGLLLCSNVDVAD